jgi:hypothetical protein
MGRYIPKKTAHKYVKCKNNSDFCGLTNHFEVFNREFLDQTSHYELLKKDSVQLSYPDLL